MLTLGKLLARGGLAKVYEVEGEPTKVCRVVEMKRPIYTSATLRALDASCRVRHPNVLSTDRFVFEGNTMYQVLDRAEGDLDHRPPRTEQEVEKVINQIGSALITLHRLGIYHRDLKAENVLYFNGTYKLADFDFVAFEDTPSSTRSTPHYNPPEVDAPQGTLPSKHDAWAFGLFIFNLLTKQMLSTAFNAKTLPELKKLRKSLVELWNTEESRISFLKKWKVSPKYFTLLVKLLDPIATFRTSIEEAFILDNRPYTIGEGVLSLPSEQESLCDGRFEEAVRDLLEFAAVEKLNVVYLAIELLYRAYPTTGISKAVDYIYLARIFTSDAIYFNPSERILSIITALRGIVMTDTWYKYVGDKHFEKVKEYILKCEEYFSLNKEEISKTI